MLARSIPPHLPPKGPNSVQPLSIVFLHSCVWAGAEIEGADLLDTMLVEDRAASAEPPLVFSASRHSVVTLLSPKLTAGVEWSVTKRR